MYSNLMQILPKPCRTVRSIEAIGQVWKWIGGSPDAEDLRIINGTLNDLIDINNQQFKVNEQSNKRMQHLTDVVNEIALRNNFKTDDLNSITTLINLDAMNHFLETIQETIAWTRTSVANSKLLPIHEINTIKTTLEEQGIQTTIPDKALNLCHPKIAINKDNLLYILKIPQMEDVESIILEVYPLIVKNTTLAAYSRYLVKRRD